MSPVRSKKHWTTAEEVWLRNNWQLASCHKLRTHLGRTAHAIYEYATKVLGLPSGMPQGMMGLKPAARRLGIDPRYLRKILHWAEVPVRAINYYAKRARMRWAVDIDEARDAIVRWENELETVEQAATRLRVAGKRLERWMVAAGSMPARAPNAKRRAPFRARTEEFDRAAAAGRARDAAERLVLFHEPLRAAARRLGTSHPTLRRVHLRIGVPESLLGSLPPAVHDAAWASHLSRGQKRAVRAR